MAAIELRSCVGGQQYTQRILEAARCAPDVMQAPVWSGGRGSGMLPIFCIGSAMADGATSYARLSRREDAWTIGGAASRARIDAKVIVGGTLEVDVGAR